MTVDFAFKRAPAYRIASIRWTGPWSDAKIHAQFRRVVAWTRQHGLRTGKWIFLEPADRTWEVGLEIRGAARSEGGVRVRTLPATRVASVVFDPEVVSSAVVYHGLMDWLRWRRKDGKVRSVLGHREVYGADPWSKAGGSVDVQFAVRP
ncbi:MAG TPA: GyrI-like domain-containing protein [Thermoplasmata archaeon]|jgi:effector-binding domain-containing protein|nr:GyrI-like domain-containing protein [Thermoplasmata archaeon]